MDLVEVDVRLFITCRLCLEEPGRYPIVPSIKEEIKYSIDIDIEPFDGLPQLICKKCKLTLSDIKTKKSTFIQKQQELRRKLGKQINNPAEPPQEIIDCTDENIETDTVARDHRPVTRDVPVSSDVSVTSDVPVSPNVSVTSVASVTPVSSQDDCKQICDLLKREYNEQFVCNICSKTYQKRSSIKRHVSSHKKVMNKHKKIFRNYCIVRLNKIDDRENWIGISKVVVYNTEKIIVNQEDSRFHTFYFKKNNENVTAEKKSSAVKRPGVFSDSSDDEICKGKKRKSRRLFSCSSTQTTVLEEGKADCEISNLDAPGYENNSNDADLVKTDCINIDDTSSDCPPNNKLESEKTMVSRKKQAKAKIANYKAIQNIVTMCHKKYIKKAQSENVTSNKPAFSESSLKHKVLSLGRKVIHKQGFGCTGLLRYMEHKDLDITWQPTSHAIQNKGSSFVRIMTKLKSREDSENDDLGWKQLHEISFCSDQEEVNGVKPDINNTTAPIMTTHKEEPKTLSPGQSTNEDQLYQLLTTSDSNKNKLLNKTPVSNPKQLPKKITASDIKPVTIRSNDVDTAILQATHESGELDDLDVDESDFCMPIITFTQSLSTAHEVEITKDKTNRSADKPAPRIKVKPASELMTERALNNQDATEDIWAFNKSNVSLPYPFTNTPVYAAAPLCPSQADYRPSRASAVGNQVTDTPTNVHRSPADTTHIRNAKSKNDEFVTLHSLELPNTKTKSPFQYFKTVLIYHGLTLLELNEELPAHYNCLVRFKLCLKQDTKRPLEVVLALFCSKNNFCFSFKDAKLKTFDPNQLPAFWQWELLKVYKSDVANKIMQNAEKISKEVYDYTKNFLCLLKSIHCISEW